MFIPPSGPVRGPDHFSSVQKQLRARKKDEEPLENATILGFRKKRIGSRVLEDLMKRKWPMKWTLGFI